MGKRELLLVAGFVLVGTVLYQLTARPSGESDRQFSLSAVVDHLRRGVRGNRAEAETTTTAAHPLNDATREIRIDFQNSSESLTITGEDRADVASEIHVWSNGYDDAEAQRLAKATVLKASEAGGRLTFQLPYPREARQRANVTLRVPSAMRVSVAKYSGKLAISGTRDVELVDSRGDATIRDVSGKVAVSHRGGDLNIADIAALKLNVRGTDVRLARVRGDLTIQAQAGEVNGSELEGAVDIEANNTDVTLERLETAKAPFHVTATNGSVRIRGVRTETRIDAHNTEVIVGIAQPTVVSVYADGGESIEITPARGGFQLDAVATAGGAITAPERMVQVTTEGDERRAAGAIDGGGPVITLRTTQGEIILRSPDTPEAPEKPRPPAPPRPPTLPPRLERRG